MMIVCGTQQNKPPMNEPASETSSIPTADDSRSRSRLVISIYMPDEHDCRVSGQQADREIYHRQTSLDGLKTSETCA
jgi:hypothetical protein